MKNTSTYTFWKLVNEFSIEIPIIQRDYAQGRENAKASQIRSKFVTDIIAAIASRENKDLDFVYGTTENGKFVPLDGQQRLTTLFLLHWYLACKSKDIDASKAVLLKFSYETRTSSREFCRALIENPIAESARKKLSEKIKDCSWFFLAWEKDPTIKAMLVMLDAIELECEKEDCAALWESLKTSDCVTFQFLNLADFQLTDDLYIKMNARGKALTDFENFKAWFGQQVEENCQENAINRWNISVEDWQKNMDKSWTDLFWQHKGKDDFLIDDEFMQFFNGMALNHYMGHAENADEETIKELFNLKYYTISDYVKCGIVSEQFVKEVSEILNQFVEHDSLIGEMCKNDLVSFGSQNSIFQNFILPKNGVISYLERARFFAICQFLLKSPTLDTSAFKAWGRVIRNITENIAIDSAESFKRAITLILELSQNCLSIYTYLGSDNSVIKSGFADHQVKEEKIKARHIVADLSLEQTINSLEAHPLLKGCLETFIYNGSLPNENLEAYSKAFYEIWSDKFNSSLIISSLLTQGNYTVETRWSGLGRQRLFGRGSNWRNIFTDRQNPKIKVVLQSFLKEYLKLSDSPENNLKQLINSWLQLSSGIKGWKYYFIKYPQMTNGKLNIFCWRNSEEAFEMRRLDGDSLHSYHLNPFAFTLVKECKLDNICNMSYSRYTDAGPLHFNLNKIMLFSLKEGWFVKLPEAFQNINAFLELQAEFNLREFKDGFLYEVSENDRIECAKALAIKLANLSSVPANLQEIEDAVLAF